MVSQVEINSKETILEVDSHADTTCLGHGALRIFYFNCPVNVQRYDLSLGIMQYQTISGVIAYTTGQIRKYRSRLAQALASELRAYKD